MGRYVAKVIVCPKCAGTQTRHFGSRRECACGHMWSVSGRWKAVQAQQCIEAIADRSEYTNKVLRELGEHGFGGAKRGGGYVQTVLKPTEGYGMRFKRWRLGKMKVTLLDMARHEATRSMLLKLHKHELQRQQLTNRQLMPYIHLIWTIARENDAKRRVRPAGVGEDAAGSSPLREILGEASESAALLGLRQGVA